MRNRIIQFLQDNQTKIKIAAFSITVGLSTYLTFRESKDIIDALDKLDSIKLLEKEISWVVSNIIFIVKINDLVQKLHASNNHGTAHFLEGMIYGIFLGNLPLTFHCCQKLVDITNDKNENKLQDQQRFEL